MFIDEAAMKSVVFFLPLNQLEFLEFELVDYLRYLLIY